MRASVSVCWAFLSLYPSQLRERHLNYETIWSGMLNVCAPSACITERSKTLCIIQHSGAAWAKLYFRLSRIVYLWERRCCERARERGKPHTLNWLTAQQRLREANSFLTKNNGLLFICQRIYRVRNYLCTIATRTDEEKKLDAVIFGIYYGTKTTSCIH